MNHKIPEFVAGQPLQRQLGAGTLNRILRELESLRVVRVVGGTVRKLPGGTEITVNSTMGAGANAANRRPLELAIVPNPETPTQKKLRVFAGTVAGGSSTDLGFAAGDTPPYLLTLQEGVVQAGITIGEDGVVTSRWIEIVDTLSDDTETDRYVEIGTVIESDDGWAVTNTAYGPIAAIICREWFSSPAAWDVTFYAASA